MLSKYYTFVICLIFAALLNAQNKQKSILPIKTDYEINSFLIATENLRTKDFIQFSENLEILNKLNNKNLYQTCFYDYLKSYKTAYLGEFNKSIDQLNDIYNQCNDRNIRVRIHSLTANLFVISGDYQKAISILDKAINEIEKIRDKTTKHYVYSAAIIVYHLVEQSDLSLKFSELLINDSPSPNNLCKGEVHKYLALLKRIENKNHDNEIEAIIGRCHDTSETVFAQILNIEWLKTKLQSNSKESNLRYILKILNQSNDIIDSTNYKNLIGIKDGLYAKIYWQLQNYNQFEKYAKSVIDGSKTIGSSIQKIEALDLMVKYYEQLSEFDTAYTYLKQKTEAERLHYDDQQAKVMAYQIVNHDNLAKTHQIKYLNNQNELLKLQNTLAEESKLNQKLVILSLLLGVAFLALWGFKHKKEQEIYRRLSELDHMTLIYNRKGMRDYMQYLLPYSEKKEELITYAIFDLDHFKRINDQYGHITGDWVIKNVIKECQIVRDNNEQVTFGRLGGEEFAIIIRDSNLDEMLNFAQKCRQSIENIDTSESGFKFQITASFGVTTTDKSGYIYTDLMSDADKALYQAKDNGRNQLIVFEASS